MQKTPILQQIDELLAGLFPTPAQKQTGIIRLPNRPPFMLASAVADFYGVSVMQLNQARRRNQKKFPGEEYCFQLTKSDITNCDIDPKTATSGGHLPWAYTKKGAHMFATILNTPTAIERSLLLVEAFVKFEEMAAGKAALQALPEPPRKMEIDEADFWKMKAELAELKLEKAERERTPKRRNANAEDEATIITLARRGMKPSEIGQRVGRTSSGISAIIKRLRKEGRL